MFTKLDAIQAREGKRKVSNAANFLSRESCVVAKFRARPAPEPALEGLELRNRSNLKIDLSLHRTRKSGSH